MENIRRIIYVDAGSTNSDNYTISLYDKESNATQIMELTDIKNNTDAEKYAVYQAILYIVKKEFQCCMILSDNQSAVNDKGLQSLINELGIKISWIPREINTVADKTCKLEPTLKEEDFHVLKLFVKLSQKAYGKKELINSQNMKQDNPSLITKLETKIKNQVMQINALKKKCEKR